MKRNDIADSSIAAKCMAGHATEMAVWRFVRDASRQLESLHNERKAHGNITLENVTIEGLCFALGPVGNAGTPAEDVWQLGACIYELITGNVPFGGQGKAGQSATSPLPVFSASKASKALSTLTARCLAFDSKERISAEELTTIANQELQRCEQYSSELENLKYKKPQNRITRMKTYDFWPEAMAVWALIILLALPQHASAQQDAEMAKLIRLTTTMRNQNNYATVLKELDNDEKWTLMDELTMDPDECTEDVEVEMFGMNDIAYEIANRERGVINHGGRFKHSVDGKHHYSFIELTAMSRTTISYIVRRHKGVQQVAVIPFDPKAKYTVTYSSDDEEAKAHTEGNGISYFSVEVGKDGTYGFQITNESQKNSSYVVVTYNPMM